MFSYFNGFGLPKDCKKEDALEEIAKFERQDNAELQMGHYSREAYLRKKTLIEDMKAWADTLHPRDEAKLRFPFTSQREIELLNEIKRPGSAISYMRARIVNVQNLDEAFCVLFCVVKEDFYKATNEELNDALEEGKVMFHSLINSPMPESHLMRQAIVMFEMKLN